MNRMKMTQIFLILALMLIGITALAVVFQDSGIIKADSPGGNPGKYSKKPVVFPYTGIIIADSPGGNPGDITC